MPIWRCRRSRSFCMRAALARSSCGRPPIGRGHNISAARCRPARLCGQEPGCHQASDPGNAESCGSVRQRAGTGCPTPVDAGFVDNYEYALQTLNDNPYAHWRDYDAEDTVRFYALRLHEVGVIKKSPQRIIADGTDLRFFDELKRELKA